MGGEEFENYGIRNVVRILDRWPSVIDFFFLDGFGIWWVDFGPKFSYQINNANFLINDTHSNSILSWTVG